MPQAMFHKNNENGYIIIVALLILALLTVISVSAINMSMTESKIATNELLYEKAFYAAEAGLQQLKEQLRTQFVESNRAILSSGGSPNWSFALTDAVDSDGDGIGDFAGSVTLLDRTLDNIDIQVNVWNNDEGISGDTSKTDNDGLIYARSQARGPRGTQCRIEVLLAGDMTSEAISDYSAQAGAGANKSFVSGDAEKLTDFEMTDLQGQ